MMKQNLLTGLVYLAAAAALGPFLVYYVNNPDAFQYLSVSRHYLNGNFSEAINGYWSPLYCWILTQFAMTGMNGILAMKLLQLLLGFFALTSWVRIVDVVLDEKKIAGWLKLSCVPFLLSYSYLNLTADLLFFSIALFILHFLLKGPVWNSLRRSMQFGFLGSVLYLGKSFGLPLFLLLVVVSIDRERRTGVQVVPGYIGKGMLLFLAVSISWIVLISMKYDRLTISEAARFNRTKEVAPLPGQVMKLPILSEGLTRPYGAHAISAWEEPLQAVVLTPLHPLTFGRDFAIVSQVVLRNIASIWYFDFRRQIGLFFLLLLAASFWADRKFITRYKVSLFYPMLFLIAFYGGYSAILVHTRYTWICTWMMLLLSARMILQMDEKAILPNIVRVISNLPLLSRWGEAPEILKRLQRIFLFLMIVLAVKRPLKELFFTQDQDLPVLWLVKAAIHPLETLDVMYKDDRDTYRAANEIARHRLLSGAIASRYTESPFRHRYSSSHHIATRSDVPYYGQINDSNAGALDTLHSNGIRYFLVWDQFPDSLFGQAPVYKSDNLAIFPVR